MHQNGIRLAEALNYLKREKGITQQELARLMGSTQTTISRNLRMAQEGNINKSFVFNMNAAVGNIFNVDYILTGEGTLFAQKPQEKVPDIIDLCSRLVSEVEELRKDVRKQFDEVAEMRNSLREERKAMTQLIQQLAALAQPQKGYTYQPAKKPQNIAEKP